MRTKTLRLRLTIIDWEYPTTRSIPLPGIWALDNQNTIMSLYLEFANGVIIELKADAETEEGLAMIRGLTKGAGSARRIELSAAEKARLWLYEEGYETYKQGKDAYIFINPKIVEF